jgi:hypothetical protein
MKKEFLGFNINKQSTLLLFVVFSIGLIHLYLYRAYQPDDAFIFLVYVKNFVQGNGLTFNGEYVEGFSSILWVYLNIFFAWLPFEYLTTSKILGILSYFLSAILVVFIVKKLAPKVTLDKLALFLLIYFTFPPLAIWSVGGLETMAYALLLLYSIYFYYNIRILNSMTTKEVYIVSGLLFGLLAAMRPEGFALAGIVLLFEFILLFRKNKFDWQFYINFIYGYIFVVFIILLWRYSLYGEILPNTVLAKTGDLHYQIFKGTLYFKKFFADYWLLIIIYFGSTFNLFIGKSTNIWLWNVLVLITISGYTLFIVASGGDWMISYRFFIPIMPLLFSIIFLSIYFSNHKIGLITSALLISLFIFKIIIYYPLVLKQARSDYGDIQLGKYIKSLNISKSEFIAVFDAGAIPFYAELPTIDMIGLNNNHIAHLPGRFMKKYDNKYILMHKPKFIQIRTENKCNQRVPFLFFDGTSKLFYMKEFQENYTFDERSSINHWFKRRESPVKNTFLDTFYEYEIKLLNLIKVANKKIEFEITKTGDGVWLKTPWYYTTGSVFIQVQIKDQSNKQVYQKLISISNHMQKDDSEKFIFEIPELKKGIYKVYITPILMKINEFNDFKGDKFEYYLHIDSELEMIIKDEELKFNSTKLEFYGWSDAEKTHRWSIGDSASIKFNIKNIEHIKGFLSLYVSTLGRQEIKVTLNGIFIANIKLNTRGEIIDIPFESKYLKNKNMLKFEFSNPHKAHKESSRILALDFKSMWIR